jgi:hypothetical protein
MYSIFPTRYDFEKLLELEDELFRGHSQGKQDRLKRHTSVKRKKTPKASSPGCGIAARRKRHLNW